MKKNKGVIYPVMERIFSSEIQNWTDITLDSMRFFFQQAEKYLDNMQAIYQRLDSKAMNLLTVNTAFLVPIIGLSLFLLQEKLWGLFSFTLVVNICFIISIILCLKITFPGESTCSGDTPRLLMNPLFISGKQKGDTQVLQIMMNQCEAYQDRIDINQRRNEFKANKIRWAIYLTCFAPLMGGLVFFFYLIFFHGFGSSILC
jgi:hypothetical protein